MYDFLIDDIEIILHFVIIGIKYIISIIIVFNESLIKKTTSWILIRNN